MLTVEWFIKRSGPSLFHQLLKGHTATLGDLHKDRLTFLAPTVLRHTSTFFLFFRLSGEVYKLHFGYQQIKE
jgi:hypothetical protein